MFRLGTKRSSYLQSEVSYTIVQLQRIYDIVTLTNAIEPLSPMMG